jgi:acyl carrier protein
MNDEKSTAVEEILGDYIRREFLFNRETIPLGPDTPLIERGIVDSLGILRLIDFVEKRFSIAIPPQEMVLKNFESINSIRLLIIQQSARK